MRRGVSVLCLTAAVLAQGACAVRIAGEDLGGGFTRVVEPVETASSVEGRDAVEHLYFRRADLGPVEFVSVAPSGNYAIFVRGGNIFLIQSTTGKLGPVTEGGFSMPQSVRWNEAEEFAEIVYADGRPSSRVELK